MSEVDDRRQRAREAAYDAVANSTPYYQTRAAMEKAIEVATQVKITDDIVASFNRAWTSTSSDTPQRRRAGIDAAFRAAGFEVVE